MLRFIPFLAALITGIATFWWLQRSRRDDCMP